MNKIIAGFTIPRSIRMLTLHGGDALLPAMVKGRSVLFAHRPKQIVFNFLVQQLYRYIAPLVSKRVAADIRKRALIEGTFGEFVPNEGNSPRLLLTFSLETLLAHQLLHQVAGILSGTFQRLCTF